MKKSESIIVFKRFSLLEPSYREIVGISTLVEDRDSMRTKLQMIDIKLQMMVCD